MLQKTRPRIKYSAIIFPSPIIYKLSKPIMDLTELYAEGFIEKPVQTEWSKYSNNGQFYNQKDNLTTFSHFTYEKTKELILINDLQGKLNQLSDPAIQCAILQNGEKDPTDLGLVGIQQFFQCQHQQCSEVCVRIGLNKRYEVQPSAQITVYAKQLQKQQLYLICINCGQQEELQNQDYSINCQRCQNLQKEIQRVKCSCCQLEYEQRYHYHHLRSTVCNICPDCEQKKCAKNQEVLYVLQQKCMQKIGQKKPICIEGYRYLRQLICRVCEQEYQMNQFISNEDYSQGFYICSECKRQK